MNIVLSTKMVLRKNILFFSLLFTLFTIGLFPLYCFDKIGFFIFVKQWHDPIIDSVMPYCSWLGHGITYGCCMLVMTLCRANCRKLIVLGGSFVCMAITVQLFKRIFFTHMLRPIACLPVDTDLHLVGNTALLTSLSFPSGHSATIFTFVSAVQLLFNIKNLYSLILCLLALTVAYSRIYLCQHFYTDIYVGALIGTLAPIIVYWVLITFRKPCWLDHSVYACVKKYL